jgi:ribonuclease HI
MMAVKDRSAKKIYFDGGCRPNPGEMEAAIVVDGKLHHRTGLGRGSSEEAEWLALLGAVDVARALGLRDIILLGDAAGVISQASGALKCRSFPQHLARFKAAAIGFASVRLRHIRRTQNLAGIALERTKDHSST